MAMKNIIRGGYQPGKALHPVCSGKKQGAGNTQVQGTCCREICKKI